MTPTRQPLATYSFALWVVFKKAPDVPGQWTAHCLDIDVISQGSSLPHAMQMIEQAIGMTLIDDLGRGRNPLERSAPKEYWDELWKIVRHGRRLTIGGVHKITDLHTFATPLFLALEKYAPSVSPKGAAAKNRLPPDINIGNIEPTTAFACA